MGICEKLIPFPQRRIVKSSFINETMLGEWIASQRQTAQKLGRHCGGKYPMMCALGDLMQEVCGDQLKVIHVNRPLADSIKSVLRRGGQNRGRYNATDVVKHQEWLWEQKQEFLAKQDHLTVEYYDLLSDTEREVGRIAGYIGVPVTQKAIEYVQPNQCHIKGSVS